MRKTARYLSLLLLALSCFLAFTTSPALAEEKIGVLYLVHGGFTEMSAQNEWDVSVQMFAHDPNHMVYKMVIWNPPYWPFVLRVGNAPKELPKYTFNYGRIGGIDPFLSITQETVDKLERELNKKAPEGVSFVVDYAAWMNSGEGEIEHYGYPRFLYNPPGPGAPVTYCGEGEQTGPWENCDPERFNVDGPAERMLDQGIDRLVLVDLTTGGVRFYKTFENIKMIKRALADDNASIPVIWANDPTNLMEESYPADPGWTRTLGIPEMDISVPLEGRPNPVISDPALAKVQVQAIEEGFSPAVADAEVGVILLNHAINDNNEYYDPKIDDTLIINNNIKNQLLQRHPGMSADNIVGAFLGLEEDGRLTREMRGESQGEAWLYERVPPTRPEGLWGFFYWDALEYLKNRGVKHIVIGFPQITTDSVLSLVEIPNQIAKEIGYKTWIKWDEKDFATYPEYGHPFADYWGVWASTDCGGVACCFEMGGCEDNRTYPPRDQPELGALNPNLAYDVSEFGHLGYDPLLGQPDPDQPVQDQYTGTWAMYQPPNAKMPLIRILKNHVLEAAGITSGCNGNGNCHGNGHCGGR